MGVKTTQLFGWEHEPSQERSTSFGLTTSFGSLSTFGTIGARRAGEESPFKAHTSPDDWAARRGPGSPADAGLSRLAQAWMERLPGPTQPVQLCHLYPRIANRLALCWPDRVLTAQVFDTLFSTKRWGRKGFPRPVLDELVLLRKYSAMRPG